VEPGEQYERVIVTVERPGDATTYDLELPATLPAGELAEAIAETMEWDRDGENTVVYQIEMRSILDPRLSRRLAPAESLEAAGVWDGAWLVLHPVATVRRRPPARDSVIERSAEAEGPRRSTVDRRTSFTTETGDEPSWDTNGRQPTEGTGYVWKRLDD
jgi:hypothetical protein